MGRELNELERRVLVQLSKDPASTTWSLSSALGLSHEEASAVLERLLGRGLVNVTPRGWEPTAEARELLEKPPEEPGGLRHSGKGIKFPFPSDVTRAKGVVKPFKKNSEEKSSE
jgi:hypothetical protein